MALRQFEANRECCCTGSEFVLQLISGGSLDLLLRVENVLQEEVKKQAHSQSWEKLDLLLLSSTALELSLAN